MRTSARGVVGRTLAGAAVIVACAAATAVAQRAPKTGPPESWDAAGRDRDGDVRVVVIQREGAATQRTAERLARKGSVRIKRSYRRIGGDVIKVPPERLAEVLAELEADPDVEAAAPDVRDQRVVGQAVPWGVRRIHADPVSRGARSGAGVRLAVIDTGIWRSPSSAAVHPDLAAAYRGGYDFVNDDAFPWDDHGHGTHVAGIIAAADNDFGVVGVAPGVRLHVLKVLGADGAGYLSDFIAALDWCIEHGITVVNYSAGGKTPWGPLEVACERARQAGITIVAAAGNDYGGPVLYPAAYPSVIAVGSTDDGDLQSQFSNVGEELDLVAPGESIRSTYLEGGYAFLMGTSMAAPHVAGAAALLAGRKVTFPPLVQDYLEATAVDLGAAGEDQEYGKGRVDARAALPALPAFLAPRAGAIVRSGSQTLVSWDPVPGAATYRLLFARGGSRPWSQIVESTAATSASWRAPVVGAPLLTGRLQVAAYDGSGRLVSVGNRGGFTVRSLRVTAPAAMTAFDAGAPLDLSWEVYATPRAVAAVTVELSRDGGATWLRRARLAAGARTYRWRTPAVDAVTNLRLRVVLSDAAGRVITRSGVSIVVVPSGA